MSYCGKDNADGALQCAVCGTELTGETGPLGTRDYQFAPDEKRHIARLGSTMRLTGAILVLTSLATLAAAQAQPAYLVGFLIGLAIAGLERGHGASDGRPRERQRDGKLAQRSEEPAASLYASTRL